MPTYPNFFYYDVMPSPVGPLTLIASPAGLHAILWERASDLLHAPHDPTIRETKKQLLAYFQGKRTTFDLPLIIEGTPFQKQVWHELRQIPYGTTISYGEQARRLGDKNKARAVGVANGRNPLSIVIPCHRVIGHSGHLVGFGGGLEKKASLLSIERMFVNPVETAFEKQKLALIKTH